MLNSESNEVAAEITAGHGRSLSQAARLFPAYRGNRPVSPSTVWRWIFEGVRLADGSRLRLGAARIGGRWLTSAQAIQRFIEAQTPSFTDGDPAAAPRTARQRA